MKFVTKQTCFFFHTFIKREKTHFCWFDLNLLMKIFFYNSKLEKRKCRKHITNIPNREIQMTKIKCKKGMTAFHEFA